MPIHRTESGVAASKARIIVKEYNDTTAVGASGYQDRIFSPPIGVIWEIISMYLNAGVPAGGASGTHEFVLKTGEIILTTGRSVFGSKVTWNNSHWQVADSAKLPPESGTTLSAILNAAFSNTEPINIRYLNQTDVSMTGTRTIRFYIKETPIT